MDVMEQIRKWHEEDRRSGLRRMFSLGDLVLQAIIHTRLREARCVQMIRGNLGHLALSRTQYNTAVRLARTFPQKQRDILTSAMMTIEKAEVLAGEAYSDRQRQRLLAKIKSGEMKPPFSTLRRRKALGEQGGGKPEREMWQLPSDPGVVATRIISRGEVDEMAVETLLARLIQMVGVSVVEAAMDRARVRLKASA